MATNEEEPASCTLKPINWMSELPEEKHMLPLIKLAIPGSHNSGSFGIPEAAECAPDAPDPIKTSLKIPVFGEAVRGICKAWSVCQRLDFSQQLECGIRYFDLRISTKKDSDDFFFVHQLYGPSLQCLLESVSLFLADHKKEVVLLDFNHFYAMEEEHHAVLISLLVSHFGDLMAPCQDISKVTLKNLWEEGKQVLIFYQHHIGKSFPEVWPNTTIIAPWPNTANEDKCIQYLTQCYSKNQPQIFVVCQGILTPQVSTILTGAGSLEATARKFSPSIYSWISESPKQCLQPLNIVMVDFVDSGDFIQRVLDLNAI